MSLRTAKLRDAMQRSLRIDTISEALPVTLVISRLVAIAFILVAVKTIPSIKYRHYFDDFVTLRRNNIPKYYLLGLIFIDAPLTTFPYNITVAFLLYRIIKKYNELLDGTIKSLKNLEELLGTEISGIEELSKYRLSYRPVIVSVYNAFIRFLFLFPALLYIDYKTSRGCARIGYFMHAGVTAAIDKDVSVIIRSDLVELSQGRHEVLKIAKGTAFITFIGNEVLSIPAAIRTHKIIRRVNTTLRVCRATVDSLASALVIVLR